MTVEITDDGSSVEVTFVASNGGRASAVVVGETVSSVKERSGEIVSKHNLEEKAAGVEQ